MKQTEPAVLAVLDHSQLTPEGRQYLEDKIKIVQKQLEEQEFLLTASRSHLSYLTSVLLCRHALVVRESDSLTQCRLCKFVWWEH